jgi:hypothetical protein
MQVVNGFVCTSCSDLSLAQQDINPARPQDNPKSPKYDPQAGTTRNDPAVRLSGALAGVEGAYDSNSNGSSLQRPPQPGDLLNVSA